MSEKLEIYKLAVEMADRVSARRMIANGFFLSLQTALVGLIALLYERQLTDQTAIIMVVSAVGLLLALTWFVSILSYKRLNKAKFTVINRMEEDLAYPYFTEEWQVIKSSSNGELKTLRGKWMSIKDRYTNLTNIETVVPIVFALIYIGMLLVSVFGKG